MDYSWSTDAVSPRRRAEAWVAELSRQVFPVRAEVARPEGFSGSFRLRSFGPTAFLRLRSRRQRIERGSGEIGPQDADWLFVSAMTRGTGYLHHDGGVTRVARGEVSFVDGGQPFALEFQRDFSYVSALVLRRDILTLLPGAERAHGTVIAAPGGPALAGFLGALESSVDSGAMEQYRLYDHFLGMAAAALAPALAGDDAPLPADATLLASIKSHLAARLERADALDDARSHFGLSRRKLQRLFRAERTTPTLWLRAARLERCARDLADRQRTLTEIARAHGFDDMTYFSRCFRDAYGATPSAWRRAQGADIL